MIKIMQKTIDFFVFSWTLLEKRPNPKTLKRFAVAHLSVESMTKRCALTIAILFEAFYGKILIYGTNSLNRNGY